MATKEGVQRKDLELAQRIADGMRRNLATASAEHTAYWQGELNAAEAEVARLKREVDPEKEES